MNISFINNSGLTHKKFLTSHLQQAEKIIFAVGFLKNSGLNNIIGILKIFCSENNKASKFFIGVGMGETDPNALEQLHNLIKDKKEHSLILCTPDAGIFHPKIYVFIRGSKVLIVTGSSNLTNHGWEINDEVSMVLETTINSPEFMQLNSYFNNLEKKFFTENIKQLIERYKNDRIDFLKKYFRHPTFKFRRKKSSIEGIDMPRLKSYYKTYQTSEYFIEPRAREEEYRKAKANLEVLSSNRILTAKQFHSYFGPLVGHKDYKPKLWHSGSIHRTTYKTLNYADSFREIVRSVKHNIGLPVSKAFDNVRDLLNKMKVEKKISGVGINIVTEIFLSFEPRKFANLNDNPVTVLSLVGKEYLISYFKGDDYEDYVNLLMKVREELGMKTFLEIDSFFNYVYWNLSEE